MEFQNILDSTNLQEEEKNKLLEINKNLGYMADMSESDIFIDGYDKSGNMIVYAEAHPNWSESLYTTSVQGKLVKKDLEPAVFHAIEMYTPIKDYKAKTQEGKTVKQMVVPILNSIGKPFAVLVREKDITSSVLREEKYNVLKKEVEQGQNFLLEDNVVREINHRIKNNLQVVVSMMRLEEKSAKTKEEKLFLEKNIQRVLIFASLHDILTYTKDVENLDIKTLITKVCGALSDSFLKENKIDITVSGDNVVIDAKRANAILIVVNELVFNSAKHAFINIQQGRIKVDIAKGNSILTISVEDNGIGFDTTCVKMGVGMQIAYETVKTKLNSNLKMLSAHTGTKAFFDIEI